MDFKEIHRRLFDRLTGNNPRNDHKYLVVSNELARVLVELNKRELHDVYMVLKVVKRSGGEHGKNNDSN